MLADKLVFLRFVFCKKCINYLLFCTFYTGLLFLSIFKYQLSVLYKVNKVLYFYKLIFKHALTKNKHITYFLNVYLQFVIPKTFIS